METTQSIANEFKLLFPQKHDALYSVWPQVAPKVLDYLKLNGKTLADCGVNADVEAGNLLGVAFLALPFIFQARGRGRSFSQLNTALHFIKFVKCETILENVANETNYRKRTFVVVKGIKSELKISECFVFLEGNIVKCESIMQAVDICFQAHEVFNLSFSTVCNPVWQFIGSIVYEKDFVHVSASVKHCITFVK